MIRSRKCRRNTGTNAYMSAQRRAYFGCLWASMGTRQHASTNRLPRINQIPLRNQNDDFIFPLNVSGKKYFARRSTLTAGSNGRLHDWFKPGPSKSLPMDKAGHFFLERDGKTFRHVLQFLRAKKEKGNMLTCLPLKPDELYRLADEAQFYGLEELRELCIDMLQRYNRQDENYVGAYLEEATRMLQETQFSDSGKDTIPSNGNGNDLH